MRGYLGTVVDRDGHVHVEARSKTVHMHHTIFRHAMCSQQFIYTACKGHVTRCNFSCNAILLLRDVKLPNTSLHYTPLMFSQHIENSSLISLINISQE